LHISPSVEKETHKMRVALFALVSLALVALAVAGAPRTIHRLSDELPHGWTRARHAKPDHKINVVIAIQHKNIDLLEEWTLKGMLPLLLVLLILFVSVM
jgi:hypothetical protein